LRDTFATEAGDRMDRDSQWRYFAATSNCRRNAGMDDLAIQGQNRGEYGLIAFSPVLFAIANGLVLLPSRIAQYRP
jgi:hypothetical protein